MSEQTNEGGKNVSEIQALTARAQELSSSIDAWNGAYVIFVALTVVLALVVFLTQFISMRKSKLLAGVQAALIAAKDSQSLLDSRAKDVKIAEASERAAEANTKTEGFRLEIAKANAQAEEARLELAKFKAPRILTPEQQEHIRLKLAGTSGEKFAAYAVFETESLNLANAIGHALLGAGWIVQTPDSDIAVGHLGNAIATGVSIELAPSHALSLRPTAMRLAEALTSEGIPCMVLEMPIREKNPEWMHIIIGKKPTE